MGIVKIDAPLVRYSLFQGCRVPRNHVFLMIFQRLDPGPPRRAPCEGLLRIFADFLGFWGPHGHPFGTILGLILHFFEGLNGDAFLVDFGALICRGRRQR